MDSAGAHGHATAANVQLSLDETYADITPVRGPGAHPFYAWLRQETGFEPAWNFNKVLIGPDGAVIDTWGSVTQPLSPTITEKIEAALPQG